MMDCCEHVCPQCEGVFGHGGFCGEGYRGRVCWMCEKQGWAMVSCEKCGEWKPSKRGLVCEACSRIRVVA